MTEKYVDFNICKEQLEKALALFELSLTIDVTEEDMNANGWVEFEDLNIDGFLSFSFYQNGFAIYSIYFDKIDVNEEVATILNEFNKNSLYFRAYVNNEGELVLEHSVAYIPDCLVYDYSSQILINIFDEALNNILSPLIERTYSDN